MRRFEPSRLIFYSYWFGANKRSVDDRGQPIKDMAIPKSWQDFPDLADGLLKECTELDLIGASASLRRLFRLFQKSDATVGEMQELMKEIQGRLVDELQGQYFLSLSVAEA